MIQDERYSFTMSVCISNNQETSRENGTWQLKPWPRMWVVLDFKNGKNPPCLKNSSYNYLSSKLISLRSVNIKTWLKILFHFRNIDPNKNAQLDFFRCSFFFSPDKNFSVYQGRGKKISLLSESCTNCRQTVSRGNFFRSKYFPTALGINEGRN